MFLTYEKKKTEEEKNTKIQKKIFRTSINIQLGNMFMQLNKKKKNYSVIKIPQTGDTESLSVC